MQTQISDEIFKRLDQLAQTLGTTSQYLYGTLAKKGLGLGLVAALLMVGFVLSLVLMLKNWEKVEFDSYDGPANVGIFARALVFSVLSIVLLVASLTNGLDLVYLISPESYATERVIRMLK